MSRIRTAAAASVLVVASQFAVAVATTTPAQAASKPPNSLCRADGDILAVGSYRVLRNGTYEFYIAAPSGDKNVEIDIYRTTRNIRDWKIAEHRPLARYLTKYRANRDRQAARRTDTAPQALVHAHRPRGRSDSKCWLTLTRIK